MMLIRRSDKQRGIMMADAVLGLLIVTATAALLATTVGQHHKAGERLSSSRGAVRAAERVLTDLQLGQAVAAKGEDASGRWEIRALDAPAPPGRAWVQVVAVHRQRSAALSGMVPAESLKEAAP